jgi:hypothetical protein
VIVSVLVLVLAVVALRRFERADTWSGKVFSGLAALILGVLGLVLLAGLIFA